MTGQEALPWATGSSVFLWRDPAGVLRAFPTIEDFSILESGDRKRRVLRLTQIDTALLVFVFMQCGIEPVLLPVYFAFLAHYLAGWAPFGACRSCLPPCRSQVLGARLPPEGAAGLFNLGMLAVLMRLRMWPKRMWRRPPQPVFLTYKFFASLFLFEFGESCIWKALERTLYDEVPLLCDGIASSSVVSSLPDVQWIADMACDVADNAWMRCGVSYMAGMAVLWMALSAARFLSMAQLTAHYLVAGMSSLAVMYKAHSPPHCDEARRAHYWGRS